MLSLTVALCKVRVHQLLRSNKNREAGDSFRLLFVLYKRIFVGVQRFSGTWTYEGRSTYYFSYWCTPQNWMGAEKQFI